MRLVTLTGPNGDPVDVNPETVETLRPVAPLSEGAGATLLTFTSARELRVMEHPATVRSLLGAQPA